MSTMKVRAVVHHSVSVCVDALCERRQPGLQSEAPSADGQPASLAELN